MTNKTALFLMALLMMTNSAFARQSNGQAAEAKANGTITIKPTDKAGLLDGSCGNDEWEAATKVELAGGAAIYFMHDQDYFYFCASGKAEDYTVLDLYIESAETNRTHKYHLSAQMGESILTDEGWKSASGKWKLKDYAGFWVPYSGLEDVENRKGPIFEKGTHRQMQIARKKFEGNAWNMMIGLGAVSHEGEGPINYPQHAKSDDKSTWAQFSFSENQALKSQHSMSNENPYLGQKPPGLIPEVFAPGMVSTEHRDNSAFFSPDMNTFYFTRMDIETKKWSLMVYKYENDQWHGSVFGPRVGRPLLSPDGKVMHLGGKYMERTETGWSEVKSHGPMIDRDDWGIMRLSASAKDTYVFDDYKNKDVIRISRLKDGKREEPQLLGEAINTGKWTAHPFIAPDESYLIWDSEREDGHGDSDLYISYRQSDGTWGEAINLGNKINSEVWEGGAYVTPDQKYIFFNRAISPENTDIYWVDAKIIEDLRPDNN